MEEILKTSDFAGEQKDITELGKNHVLFLPYLMGERTPHNDANAKGAFIGMTLDTTRADMIQAVFEGVAFAIRDSLEVAKSLGLDIKETTMCGGGAKSPLWRKIMANVLGIKVNTVEIEEGPAYGGAILAAIADGVYTDVKSATDAIVRKAETVEPEAELVALYNEKYECYRKSYPALKDVFHSL